MDYLIAATKRDVDRTLLRESLKLSPEERVLELMALLRAAEEFARAGRMVRGEEVFLEERRENSSKRRSA
jgi:hypothetical protein